MFTNGLKRPALGQVASLGTLYDARSDNFLPHSLTRGTLVEGAVNSIDVSKSQMIPINNETYKEKFQSMEINPELSASLLADLVQTRGSGRYMTRKSDALPTVHRALRCTITTQRDSLILAAGGLGACFDLEEPQISLAIKTGLATHVVTEITWGVQSIVAASQRLSSEADRSECEKSLKAAFQKFEGIGNEDYADPPSGNGNKLRQDSLEVSIYSDFRDDLEGYPSDLDIAYTHVLDLPRLLESCNSGKGRPLAYTLIPISLFSMFFGGPAPANFTTGQLSPECLQKLVTLLDELHDAQQRLTAYHEDLKEYHFCIKPTHLQDVENRLRNSKRAESLLMMNFVKSLKAIRACEGTTHETWLLLETFLQGDYSPKSLLDMTGECTGKIKFIDMAMQRGAGYVGYRGSSLDEVLRSKSWDDAYALYFNNKVMGLNESWDESVALLLELLPEERLKSLVLVVDCDATGENLEKSYISQFCKGPGNMGFAIAAKDISEQRRHLADKCLMRYDERHLDTAVMDAPAQRRTVKVPCPSPYCNRHEPCDWICATCFSPLEYGNVDRYLYCDCGRTPFDKFGFKCAYQGHGSSYVRYETDTLLRILERLPTPPELNILILGETGVGKSTFINAFVNYLTFSSLDEALGARELNFIIPCSFATQRVDEHTGELVQEKVKIGFDADEVDGSKGDSATQKATAYPLYIGGTLVRLIDTPGIGDVRGTKQDEKNMVDILSVLRNYDKLHGILVLLKSNNARLNVMFRFCIKELLTHLHRSAAENMVFGFTNTRGSNFQPGDTFTPLKTLLREYDDVIKGLFRETVFCFDSESFRYLAAKRRGLEMGNLEDYRRSWDHSANEAQRLVARFRELKPHQVKNTLSLNETRYLISQMTAPIAQISKAITESIAKSARDAKDLSNTRLTGAALQAKLKIEKTVVEAKESAKPITVCANESCVKRVQDSKSGSAEVKLRKSLCHNPCCLTNVPPDSIGAAGLINCAAFKDENCMRCHHHWRDHEHVRVLYSERSETTVDASVQSALQVHGNEVQAKQAQIKALAKRIEEYKAEHRQLQEAAAMFSVYLKASSITHYNDATLEYMDHLIKEEKAKVNLGGRRDLLETMEKDRAQYKSFVDTMEDGILKGKNYSVLDEDGVYNLVQTLYTMPHYGRMLRDVANVVGMAYAATFREKPVRIRGLKYWKSQSHHSYSSGPTMTLTKRPSQRTRGSQHLARNSYIHSSSSARAQRNEDFRPSNPLPAQRESSSSSSSMSGFTSDKYSSPSPRSGFTSGDRSSPSSRSGFTSSSYSSPSSRSVASEGFTSPASSVGKSELSPRSSKGPTSPTSALGSFDDESGSPPPYDAVGATNRFDRDIRGNRSSAQNPFSDSRSSKGDGKSGWRKLGSKLHLRKS